MTRALLGLAIGAAVLATAQEACCRPPDQVAHSPIPPLTQASQSQPSQSQTSQQETGRVAAGGPAAPAPPFDPKLLPQTTPQGRDSASANIERQSAATTNPERLKLWNSPAMLEAREAVMDFSRRSAQTSPAEGEQFLARLSQLPTEEMRNWLERFQARRSNSLRSQQVERMGNRMAVEQAVRRQEAVRQAGANVADLRSQAAKPHFSPTPQPHIAHYPPFSGPSPFGPTRVYNPFDPVIDPMSPRGFRRAAAAAASLPGDLPRGDPRNFIRGEEGIDFGESANRPSSDTPPVPVGPVAPPSP